MGRQPSSIPGGSKDVSRTAGVRGDGRKSPIEHLRKTGPGTSKATHVARFVFPGQHAWGELILAGPIATSTGKKQCERNAGSCCASCSTNCSMQDPKKRHPP